MDYNDAMSRGSGPAQRSGWRRSVEQWVRFEYALAGWEWSRIDGVLDLGCGTGELAAWLRRSGRSADYTGIDLRDDVIREARDRHPEARFLNGDLYRLCDGEVTADLAVGIGTLIDGEPPGGDDDVDRRLVRLVDAVVASARVGAVVMALNRRVVQQRASLRLEPAVFGVERRRFAEVLGEATPRGWEARVTGDLLGTDLVGMIWREGTYDAQPHGRIQERACRRALELGDSEPGDRAWLQQQVGGAAQSSTKESN